MCQKRNQYVNTRINLEFEFNNQISGITNSIFQYVNKLENVQFDIKASKTIKTSNFMFANTIAVDRIIQCHFNISLDNCKNIYGLSQYIAVDDISMENTIINLQSYQMQGEAFSIAQQVLSNIQIINCYDYSQLSGQYVSMFKQTLGDVKITNSYFYQTFKASNGSASIITLSAEGTGKAVVFQVQNCQFKAIASNEVPDGKYGLVGSMSSVVQPTFESLSGYISGAYESLTQDRKTDYVFKIILISISIDNSSQTLISTDIDVNNTKITIGSMDNNNVTQSGRDVSLLGSRSVYYGVQIVSSGIRITANTFTYLAPVLTGEKNLINLYFDIDVEAQTQKLAGLSISTAGKTTVKNCKFEGDIKNTQGSIFLLFETARQLVTIENLTTECDLTFNNASYGLIKTVQGGINIININSNISMSISGENIVTSSLMFDTVSGAANAQSITGYYGGYVSNMTCASTSCSFQPAQGVISLEPRTLTNVSLSSDQSITYDGKQYTIYQPSSTYLGKLNCTKVTFSNLSVYSSYTVPMYNVLGDTKIVVNVEVTAHISAKTNYSLCGGIAGVSRQTTYEIKNVKSSITFQYSAYNSSITPSCNASDFFGVLTVPVTLENVTSAGDIVGAATIGGIVGYLAGVAITMKNVTIEGTYQSSKFQCGGVIGAIANDSTTTLQNATFIDAKISSMSEGSGPVYGENNGTIAQMNIISMSLNERSYYNDCPIGMGNSYEYSQCPAKSNSVDVTVSSFDLSTYFSYNSYHSSYTTYHVFANDVDYNNTNFYITYAISQPSLNASLFGKKASYSNVNIEMLNADGNMSWGSDYTGFSFLQSLIDDETTLINNIHIQGYLYGRNYGNCGPVALLYASNASVSNVTTNISKIYFYYGSAFIAYINASAPTFTNIQVNGTFTTAGGSYGLAFYNISKGTLNPTFQNCSFNTTTNSSSSYNIRGFNSQSTKSYYSDATYTFVSCKFQTHNVKENGTQDQAQDPLYSTLSIAYLSFDNCTFNLQVYSNNSISGLYMSNQIEGWTNYTDCTFSGYVNQTGNTNSNAIGTLEGYTMYGTRNIINCIIQNQQLIGRQVIGGLIGQLGGAASLYVSNTSVSISVIANTTSSYGIYYGGFIGYVSSQTHTISIQYSQFENINDFQGIDCVLSSNSSYADSFTDFPTVTCPSDLTTVALDNNPTFTSGYYGYSSPFSNASAACYWLQTSSGDWNSTLFNFTSQEPVSNCSNMSSSLYTIFNPTFNPKQVTSVTVIGQITAVTWFHATFALQSKTAGNTIFNNVKLQHTFKEYTQRADYQLNLGGIVFYGQSSYTIQFVNCENSMTNDHSVHYKPSYASGLSHWLQGTTIITNCVTNFTLIDYQAGQTTAYSVSCDLGGSCTSTGFTTTHYDGQCL